MTIDAIRECFAHNRWANDRLAAAAAKLADAQLDQPFEIGPGSLRAALRHVYGAERIWHQRVDAPGHASLPRSETLTDVVDASHRLDNTRDPWLAGMADDDLGRTVNYRNLEGQSFTNRLGDILLHVCNHGVHHRAQALNMLRRLGVKPPGLDYLFMRIERPDQPARPLDAGTMADYFAYGDWACGRVFDAAATLSDEQLDRPMDLGVGPLRKTLLHVRDAETWWLENWSGTPPEQFTELDARTSIAELRALFAETARRRDDVVAAHRATGLGRTVTARPSPGETYTFRLGESMLQLCGHGTHHRAQALNMLRRLGAAPPALDYILWRRESSPMDQDAPTS